MRDPDLKLVHGWLAKGERPSRDVVSALSPDARAYWLNFGSLVLQNGIDNGSLHCVRIYLPVWVSSWDPQWPGSQLREWTLSRGLSALGGDQDEVHPIPSQFQWACWAIQPDLGGHDLELHWQQQQGLGLVYSNSDGRLSSYSTSCYWVYT